MRIALTGISGFIGGHLADRLLASGHQVRALSRRPVTERPAPERPGLTVVRGSLEDAAALRSLVDGCEAVVHAAGLTLARSAAEFEQVNAAATEALAAICAAQDRPPLFLLLSSLAARAPTLSHYAASKARAEAAVAAQPGLEWVALRPPAVYGPRDTATLTLFRMMSRGWLLVPPDRSARVSLIHVADLCGAVEALLTTRAGCGSVLEVRDDCAAGYDWRRIAAVAAECLQRPVRCVPVPEAALWLAGSLAALAARVTGRPGRLSPGKVRELCHIDWVCRDNPVADLTPWRPEMGIEPGFRQTLDWYRSRNWL